MLTQLETIREQVLYLYRNNRFINVDITLPDEHILRRAVKATITGVYPHIFRLEVAQDGRIHKFTLSYADIIAGRMSINQPNI